MKKLLILLLPMIILLTACEPKEYTVTFETNSESVIEDVVVIEGEGLTLPFEPFKDEHTFNGWYTDESLTIMFSGKSVNESFTLYAKYDIILYDLTLETSNDEISVIHLAMDEVFELPVAIKEGFDFLGWDLDGEEELLSSTYTMPNGPVELLAVFERSGPMNIAFIYCDVSTEYFDSLDMVNSALNSFIVETEYSYNVYDTDFIDDDIHEAIDLAVIDGADLVILGGWVFSNAAFVAQETYPEVNFVIYDGEPTNLPVGSTIPNDGEDPFTGNTDNTTTIMMNFEQGGFLVGYSLVKDGYRNLGFMGGMSIPPIEQYGIGFIAGAEAAALELNVEIDIKYQILNDFTPNSNTENRAVEWYQSGVEVIFTVSAGGDSSVMRAAEIESGKVVTADVDATDQSASILFSLVRDYDAIVTRILELEYDYLLPFGETERYGVAKGIYKFTDSYDEFNIFTASDFDDLIDSFGEGLYTTNDLTSATVTDYIEDLVNTTVEVIIE